MKSKTIHLEKANTLSNFITEEERFNIVSLKITGFIGNSDFDDVLDEMCSSCGDYDDDDNYTLWYELSPALRHLDMGEATYVDGDALPDFGHRTLLETIILPQGIKSTCWGFETELAKSDSLQTLVLPEGIKTVSGFFHCPKLTDLVLPEDVETIEEDAFYGCESITEIRIPASVKSLKGNSFAGCSIEAYDVDERNPYYTVVDGVVYTKDRKTLVAFPSAYPKKHFVVPSTTLVIGDYAFCASRLEHVELPDGLTAIMKRAFESCLVRDVNIPDTVATIGTGLFSYCMDLEHVGISAKLTEIPWCVFEWCPKLKELVVPSDVRKLHYSSITWSRGIERLVLQDGMEEIVGGGDMFVGKSTLREVIIPKTLKKLQGGVFNHGPHLDSFCLDPDNPYFCILGEALCSKDGKTLISIPGYHRETYSIPEGVEVVAECAFKGVQSLRTIYVPSSVEEVGHNAFREDNLETVVMEGCVPPKMTGKAEMYEKKVLYVPHEAVSAYEKAPGWNCFIVKGCDGRLPKRKNPTFLSEEE